MDVDEAVGIPGEKISIFIFLDLALINLVVEQHWTSVWDFLIHTNPYETIRSSIFVHYADSNHSVSGEIT